MKFEEANKKLKELIGYDRLGFVQHDIWNRYITMIKVESYRTLLITYTYYPPEGFRNLIVNGVLRYFIVFPKVNKILSKASDGLLEIRQPAYHDTTIKDTYDNFLAMSNLWDPLVHQDFIENGVYHEDRLIAQCNVHEECIEKYALPFFEKHKTLDDVYDDVIKHATDLELASSLPVNPQLIKLIIQKIVNCSGYNAQREWVLGRSEVNMNSDKKSDQQLGEFYGKLVQYLDSGQYRELDDKPFVDEEQKPSPITIAKPLAVLPVNDALMIRFAEACSVLADVGIVFNPTFTLNDYRHDINWKSWDLETLEGQHFLCYLLLFAGTQVHDAVIDQYTSVSPNVYFFNSEWDGAVDYGEILERLNALTNNTLSFENIEGHFDDLIGVSFTYKAEPITWEFKYDNDWTDYKVFNKFLELVKDDLTKEFYILIEGQGGLIFYFDEGDKVEFKQVFPGRELIRLREFVE